MPRSTKPLVGALFAALLALAAPLQAQVIGGGGVTPGAGRFSGGPVTNPILLPDGSAGAPSAAFANETSLGLYRTSGGGQIGISSQGVGVVGTNGQNQLLMQSGVSFGWEPGGLFGASADLILARDAANTLAQRNGTNAQGFNIYNTFTDASNYERLAVGFASNVAVIGPSAAGTGSNRSMRFQVNGAVPTILFNIAGTDVWTVSNAGNFVGVTQSRGLGYGTGAGGAVTQITSRATGVTLNTVSGDITLFSAAGSATAASFTVTDSAVAATDNIVINQKSGTNVYETFVTTVGAGSFVVTFFTTGGTAVDAPVFHFSVIKGAIS